MIYPWNERIWAEFRRRLPALPHAVLLHGPRGTGKFEFARSAAGLLLCNSPTGPAGEGEACGTCAACRLYTGGNHPDFFGVQPEADTLEDTETEEAGQTTGDRRKKPSTQILIEQIREVVASIQSGSHQGGRRVILISPAEAMNTATANALLKTLEEPPAQTIVLLVAHEAARLLPTIRSRCQAVGFTEPDRESAIAWLAKNGIQDAAARLALFGGAPLTALESAGDGPGLEVRALIDRFTGAPDALTCADALASVGPPVAVDWLQRWTSDILLYRLCGRIRYHPDLEVRLAPLARAADASALFDYWRSLHGYRRIARHPVNPRLYAERLALDYFECVRGAQ